MVTSHVQRLDVIRALIDIFRRNPQYKKHKTWDGDAILVVNGSKGMMYDLEGKMCVKITSQILVDFSMLEHRIGVGKPASPICEGKENIICGKEIAIDHAIKSTDFLSGACFGRTSSALLPQTNSTSGLRKQFVPPTRSGPAYTNPAKAEKKGIPLLPVDLVAKSERNPLKQDSSQADAPESHWSVNWCGHHITNKLRRRNLILFLQGGSNNTRSIKPGTVMHFCHIQEIS
jgi:DNA repair and recombination protein RAD54B